MIRRDLRWPLFVIGLLGATVGGNAYMIYRAVENGPTPMEPDYYRKAIGWDSTVAQAALNARLGWSLVAEIDTARTLQVAIVDSTGQPVSGADVRVEAFPVGASSLVAVTLAETGRGEYRGALDTAHSGLHEVRFTVSQGSARFTSVQRGVPGSRLQVIR